MMMLLPSNTCVRHRERQFGFTLIELSIVLVIIAFIVGAVLEGVDLKNAADVRATVSQKEAYSAAASAFKLKYNALPGDIPNATVFGFAARGSYAGEGDGDGFVAGIWNHVAGGLCGPCQGSGETGLFWRDLTQANLIDKAFNTATASGYAPNGTAINLDLYIPSAKIGNGNYFTVSSDLTSAPVSSSSYIFTLSQITQLSGAGCMQCPTASGSIQASQAYSIDTKIDDGNPTTGSVIAAYYSNTPGALRRYWSGTGSTSIPASITSSNTTCFDNNAGTTDYRYTMDSNNGQNAACALTFVK